MFERLKASYDKQPYTIRRMLTEGAVRATDKRAPQGFAPIAIGLGLTLIHLISIPVTNTSVNPARSTGVALAGAALSRDIPTGTRCLPMPHPAVARAFALACLLLPATMPALAASPADSVTTHARSDTVATRALARVRRAQMLAISLPSVVGVAG